MPAPKLTTEILIAAIEGFEAQKLRIDAQIAELRTMLSGDRPEPAPTPKAPKGKRRKMSAAARKRIGDAQRKRWAESKGEAQSPSEIAAPERLKPKRRLSAAGKAAIVAALKKRWAVKRAAAKKTTPASAKKGVAKKTTVKKAAKAPVKESAKKVATRKPQKKVASAPGPAAAVNA
jgi:hypothetical protein